MGSPSTATRARRPAEFADHDRGHQWDSHDHGCGQLLHRPAGDDGPCVNDFNFAQDIQVISGPQAGNFTFELQRPSVGGAVRLSAYESSGLSFGQLTQTFTLTTVGSADGAAVRLRDGRLAGRDTVPLTSATPASWFQVLPNTVYDSTVGYGWTAPVSGAYRPTTPATNAMRTDLNFGTTGTFQIAVEDRKTYNVRIYMADSGYNHDQDVGHRRNHGNNNSHRPTTSPAITFPRAAWER